MALPFIIAPSILSANFQKLQAEIDDVAPYADWLQIDVMDGHFVPNLSFGAPVMQWLKTDLPLDVHLMVTNPEDRIDEFVKAGASHITFHAEAVKKTEEQRRLIGIIRSKGCTAGIALNPATPLEAVLPLFSSPHTEAPPDLLLIMTVNPGFGGQEFITDALTKVREARRDYPKLTIQVDGGINAETAKIARAAGANNLVAGSFVFRSPNRQKAIASLRE